jgi:hypothetical protein
MNNNDAAVYYNKQQEPATLIPALQLESHRQNLAGRKDLLVSL